MSKTGGGQFGLIWTFCIFNKKKKKYYYIMINFKIGLLKSNLYFGRIWWQYDKSDYLSLLFKDVR